MKRVGKTLSKGPGCWCRTWTKKERSDLGLVDERACGLAGLRRVQYMLKYASHEIHGHLCRVHWCSCHPGLSTINGSAIVSPVKWRQQCCHPHCGTEIVQPDVAVMTSVVIAYRKASILKSRTSSPELSSIVPNDTRPCSEVGE